MDKELPTKNEADAQQVKEWYKFQVPNSLAHLEAHLENSVYLVSNYLTQADLYVYNLILPLIRNWDDVDRLKYSNITRWFDFIQHTAHGIKELVKIKLNVPQILQDIETKNKGQQSGTNTSKDNKKEKTEHQKETHTKEHQKETHTKEHQKETHTKEHHKETPITTPVATTPITAIPTPITAITTPITAITTPITAITTPITAITTETIEKDKTEIKEVKIEKHDSEKVTDPKGKKKTKRTIR